jgi:hypothetical protein
VVSPQDGSIVDLDICPVPGFLLGNDHESLTIDTGC